MTENELMEKMFNAFQAHITSFPGISDVKDEKVLRTVFLKNVYDIFTSALDLDQESGSFLDELYGDEINDCIEFEDDEDEE